MTRPLSENDFRFLGITERQLGGVIWHHGKMVKVRDVLTDHHYQNLATRLLNSLRERNQIIDSRGVKRQEIITSLMHKGISLVTRADWQAQEARPDMTEDWDYHSIALHHAGNSYSCDANGAAQMQKVQKEHLSKFSDVGYHFGIDCQGVIYEGRDIRYKGEHIAGGNTGRIGIVMLSDMSLPGEAFEQEYKEKSFPKKVMKVYEWLPDKFSTVPDSPPENQVKALTALIRVLRFHFPVATLGGHREYQLMSNKEGRACPGAYGMVLVNHLRAKLKLRKP